MDKFILERKPKKVYSTNEKYPRIRTTNEAFEAVVAAAAETGKTMSEITSRALLFAMAHVEYIDME